MNIEILNPPPYAPCRTMTRTCAQTVLQMANTTTYIGLNVFLCCLSCLRSSVKWRKTISRFVGRRDSRLSFQPITRVPRTSSRASRTARPAAPPAYSATWCATETATACWAKTRSRTARSASVATDRCAAPTGSASTYAGSAITTTTAETSQTSRQTAVSDSRQSTSTADRRSTVDRQPPVATIIIHCYCNTKR